MKISEQLLQCAAEVRRGWTQFALEDNSGNVCAYGAMNRVAYGGAMRLGDNIQRLGLVRYLQKALGQSIPTIVDWNNAFTRTQENVAQAFELAAILAEQDEARIGVSETMPAYVEVMGITQ